MEYRAAGLTERAEFFEAIVEQLGADADEALRFLGMSLEELREAYMAVGEVRSVLVEGRPVGNLWLELRDRTLHVHGFILEPASRGQGFGTRIVDDLRREFEMRAEAIEVGVQASNTDALRFYERVGFHLIEGETARGFLILRMLIRRSGRGATG